MSDKKARKKYVSHACLPCAKGKRSCSHGRPCERCTKLGREADCVDAPELHTVGHAKKRKVQSPTYTESICRDPGILTVANPSQHFGGLTLSNMTPHHNAVAILPQWRLFLAVWQHRHLFPVPFPKFIQDGMLSFAEKLANFRPPKLDHYYSHADSSRAFLSLVAGSAVPARYFVCDPNSLQWETYHCNAPYLNMFGFYGNDAEEGLQGRKILRLHPAEEHIRRLLKDMECIEKRISSYSDRIIGYHRLGHMFTVTEQVKIDYAPNGCPTSITCIAQQETFSRIPTPISSKACGLLNFTLVLPAAAGCLAPQEPICVSPPCAPITPIDLSLTSHMVHTNNTMPMSMQPTQTVCDGSTVSYGPDSRWTGPLGAMSAVMPLPLAGQMPVNEVAPSPQMFYPHAGTMMYETTPSQTNPCEPAAFDSNVNWHMNQHEEHHQATMNAHVGYQVVSGEREQGSESILQESNPMSETVIIPPYYATAQGTYIFQSDQQMNQYPIHQSQASYMNSKDEYEADTLTQTESNFESTIDSFFNDFVSECPSTIYTEHRNSIHIEEWSESTTDSHTSPALSDSTSATSPLQYQKSNYPDIHGQSDFAELFQPQVGSFVGSETDSYQMDWRI
eukprot:GILK01006422.1.p1 GENE.GILK01006422.1~~GILK01006422.1.p1  ORF type:complete len:630 (-),score=101.09 GILK01006422.1:268-2124(-)